MNDIYIHIFAILFDRANRLMPLQNICFLICLCVLESEGQHCVYAFTSVLFEVVVLMIF